MITGEVILSRYPPFALQRKGPLGDERRLFTSINCAGARCEPGYHR